MNGGLFDDEPLQSPEMRRWGLLWKIYDLVAGKSSAYCPLVLSTRISSSTWVGVQVIRELSTFSSFHCPIE